VLAYMGLEVAVKGHHILIFYRRELAGPVKQTRTKTGKSKK
jgi:hypothetical protein